MSRTLFDAGFADGLDETRPLPPADEEAEYVDGFVRGRIRAAREYDSRPMSRYPLPCAPLEVEIVLEYRSPYDALRMLRLGEMSAAV